MEAHCPHCDIIISVCNCLYVSLMYGRPRAQLAEMDCAAPMYVSDMMLLGVYQSVWEGGG